MTMLCRLLKTLKKKCYVCNNFWFRVFLLTVGTVGLDAAFAVETNYAIPVLLKAGLQERYASIVWAFSPVLGIFFQGYLGSASDSCRCSWGRRRPFVLGLAICVCVSLIIFPYGSTVASSLPLSKDSEKKLFIFIYALFGFGIMDFCLDQFDPPMRMYLLDSVSVEQSGRANFIFTAMSSLGVCCGAIIGAINWSQLSGNENETENFDYQVRFVFGTVAVLFVLCVIVSLNSFSEKLKPGDISSTSAPYITYNLPNNFLSERNPPLDVNRSDISDGATNSKMTRQMECKVNFETEIKEVIDNSCCSSMTLQLERKVSTNSYKESDTLDRLQSDKTSHENGCGLFENISISFRGTFEFVCYISPHTLVLWVMSLLDWIASLSLTIFISDYVGIVVYGGSPDTSLSEEASNLYDNGVRMTSRCRAVVCLFDLLYVIALEYYSKRLNHRWLLVCGHFLHVGTLALLLAMPCIGTVLLVLLSTSVLCSHLLSIPYTLIHNYKVGQLVGCLHVVCVNVLWLGKLLMWLICMCVCERERVREVIVCVVGVSVCCFKWVG